jgi:hypothetical protein
MGIADFIRIALGKLTPEEQAERDAAARQRQAMAEQRAAAQAAEQQAVDEVYAYYHQRLARAGGVANLVLVCHTDTWAFIKNWMDYDKRPYGWWRKQHHDRVTVHPSDMLSVRLSGPQVAEVLARIAWVSRISGVAHPWGVPHPGHTDQAVARRVYAVLGAVLDQVDPDAPGEQELPPAVVDDRPAAPAEPER